MLCELSEGSFVQTWFRLSCLETLFLFITSAPVFYYYYARSNVTYEKWIYKSNPKFPSPQKVRDEIVQMIKGMLCATVCPALSLTLAQYGVGNAFCGWGDRPVSYHIGVMLFSWILSDFFEFFYHRLGHVDLKFWTHHKHHHVFHNPSPFSVIADEPIDQFFRSSPLLVLPLLIPINMDLLFLQFGLFFYTYGVYLHSGYEHSFISPHNKIINTSFQHYAHHARSSMNTPYHCGFFLKIWDQLFSSCYPEDKECFCAECGRGRGERTIDEFNKIDVPDYSVLLRPSYWMTWKTFKIEARD
ncbi:delta(7)-sterol 5(6)-desaturase erg32 [Eurytemora carolleeae]|uniref:delta(7)-sterol 5(6)-desaturase erg32 n=1 Tax=Eurytemora carolleeae TaxID=1294199 RepID=UPI000C78C131|nr:delta(7)-sterol 5(6)-desaturase erg32 [Eurytemora carolleeae]|eukprot:XP_023336753.1 delta(7)-sterol 5(6)-desaturase erg32-like [Eurytemora affinis]